MFSYFDGSPNDSDQSESEGTWAIDSWMISTLELFVSQWDPMNG